jgi:dTDP-4-dehydrorhamnose 3,5-epimerase
MPESKIPDGAKILKGERIVEGVKVVPLRRIADERGTIHHMLRSTDRHFIQFGEIYFATVYPGAVKAWHLNSGVTLNYACVVGHVKLVIYDERESSSTKGSLFEIFIGQDNYCLVTVPPDVWSGMKGLSTPYALVANCTTLPHDPKRSTRIDPFKNHIPYDWSLKHC